MQLSDDSIYAPIWMAVYLILSYPNEICCLISAPGQAPVWPPLLVSQQRTKIWLAAKQHQRVVHHVAIKVDLMRFLYTCWNLQPA